MTAQIQEVPDPRRNTPGEYQAARRLVHRQAIDGEDLRQLLEALGLARKDTDQ